MLEIIPEKQFQLSPYLYMQFAEPLSNADSSVDAAWDYVGCCWQPDTIALLQYLAPPMIRWGGCFASYYHWRNGVGPREKRKPMLNLCWDGMFSNQIGTAEFMDLCRALKSEPLMCVNMESDGRPTWAEPFPGANLRGTAEEAAEWVDYCNNPSNTCRRNHGYKEPFGIRYWQVGNETSYGYWEANGKRNFVHDGFTCGEAAEATLRFARAMRDVDSDLRLIAWGDDGWAPEICERTGELIDLIAFHCHFSCNRNNSGAILTDRCYRHEPAQAWEQLMRSGTLLEKKIKELEEQTRPYGKRLAMTEGHFCIEDGRDRGDVLSSWAAGVAYARNLNIFARHGERLEIATSADFFGNRWRVNAVMLPTPAYAFSPYLMPVGEVMGLFSRHSGKFSIPTTCSEPYADITASMDGNRIFLHIVNTSYEHSVELPFRIASRTIQQADAWEICVDPWDEINALEPERFRPRKRKIDPQTYRLPAAGVAVVELLLEP